MTQKLIRHLLTSIYIVQNIGLGVFFYLFIQQQNLSLFPLIVEQAVQGFFLTIVFILFMQAIFVQHLPKTNRAIFFMLIIPYLYLGISAAQGISLAQRILDAAFIYQATLVMAFLLVLARIMQRAITKRISWTNIFSVLPQLIFIIPSIAASWIFFHTTLQKIESPVLYLTTITISVFGSVGSHYHIILADSIAKSSDIS